MKTLLLILGLAFIAGQYSCKKEEEPVLNSETDIAKFTLSEETGDAIIDAAAHTVDIEVVAGTDLTTLSPTFTLSTGATAVPASGTSGNYSNEVTITVTAQDGVAKQAWKVNVTKALYIDTDILTFTMPGQTGVATPNSTDHTVTIQVAEGTVLTSLIPIFTLSEGATADPASETAGDYTNPVTITVTAEDVTISQDWTVTVTEVASDATDILTFTMPGETGTATPNSDDHTIDIEVENGTNLTALTPTFTLSDGATSAPASGTVGDYSSAFVITVTAADGTTIQDWTVTVSEAGSDATDIEAFTLTEQTGDAIINSDLHKVVIKVAAATDLTNLTPEFTLSAGATSDPASGTAGDYSATVTITVTAEDETTTQDWLVRVLEEGVDSDETDIEEFTLPEQTGDARIDIINHTVDIEVVSTTVPTSLTPTFILSEGATSVPVSDIAGDYSSPVTITVTAEDGNTVQAWTVTVSVAVDLSDATDILSFAFTEETGTATPNSDDHTVDIEVANGTVLTSLTPTFTLSGGATSDPASGIAGDYSSPVIITVTAEDGTTFQPWTVTVTEAASDATDILTFTFVEETGTATPNSDDHTVAIEVALGTDLTDLIPTFTLSPGATSDPASDIAGDYSSPVIITVTAQDGSTIQAWTVTVTEAASDATDILSFSFPEETGEATPNPEDHTVAIEVAEGTDVTKLTPTFALSDGATSDPASGMEGDYSDVVTITVTAEDETTQEWTVTVTVEASGGATSVEFDDGGTKATRILNLVVDGVTYDVEIKLAFPSEIYGAYEGTYTFNTNDAAVAAIDAVNIALNDADATQVGQAGEAAVGRYRIGYLSFISTVGDIEMCRFKSGVFEPDSWREGLEETNPYNSEPVTWAVFTEQ